MIDDVVRAGYIGAEGSKTKKKRKAVLFVISSWRIITVWQDRGKKAETS